MILINPQGYIYHTIPTYQPIITSKEEIECMEGSKEEYMEIRHVVVVISLLFAPNQNKQVNSPT